MTCALVMSLQRSSSLKLSRHHTHSLGHVVQRGEQSLRCNIRFYMIKIGATGAAVTAATVTVSV